MPIQVGHINGTYGVKGWLRIYSYMQPRVGILQYSNWKIEHKNTLLSFKLEDGKEHKGGQSILAKLAGLDSPEASINYQKSTIYIDDDQLPPLQEGEYYWHELIGKEVINSDGIVMGKVIDLMETGANDVLVVEGKNRYLIPFRRPEIVYQIGDAIRVHWQKDWL